MTQAEMFNEALEFQNRHIATCLAYTGDTWTEEAKLEITARHFYGGAIQKCRQLASFIKEKIGNLTDREALIEARKKLDDESKKEADNAEAELTKNIKDNLIEKAKKTRQEACKKRDKAKRKYQTKSLLYAVGIVAASVVLFTGSFAILAPLINVVSAFIAGLSIASASVLGVGICYNWSNIKDWWKKKGSNKVFNREKLKKEAKESEEAVKKAESELDARTAERKALMEKRNQKKAEYEKQHEEFNAFEKRRNPNVRKLIDKVEDEMRYALIQKESDPSVHSWAVSHGRAWLGYALACLELAYDKGCSERAGFKEELSQFVGNYIGEDGMFDRANKTRPKYDEIGRRSLYNHCPTIARKQAEIEEGFWQVA